MAVELVELGPGDAGWHEVEEAWSPGEVALLAADHPFLAAGAWRACLAVRSGAVLARLVASVDPRQRAPSGPVGCIGFAGMDREGRGRPGARRAFGAILALGLDWLRQQGARVARGPVQFSTWYGHRAMTDGLPDEAGAPAFALEPHNGRALLEELAAAGFRPAHRAVSCLVRSDAVIGSAGAVLDRFGRAGWRDRPLRSDAIDTELALLHRLSGAIFREAWGFSEISLPEFLSIYGPAAGRADPELVRVATDGDGRPIGFAFALPAAPGRNGGRPIIVKSLGLLPDARRRVPGAGAGLAAIIHRAALEGGFRDGIHALMAEGSSAHRLSLRWGTVMRSYATFERAL